VRDLLEAGVHFGHQTRRWNPKMKPFIFAQRNGIYIVDLRQTAAAFQGALEFLEEVAGDGGAVLFVGTKRQAQDAVADAAQRTGMYYVNQRWLGGLLTNFETIRRSVGRLKDLEAMSEDGRMDLLPKKEVISLNREHAKLLKNLAGIKDMEVLPQALFVIDVRRERIAVKEAMKLGIPIVAVVDTNCDPEGIDFVVPGNDDALRAIRLFVGLAADAIEQGRSIRSKRADDEAAEAEAGEVDAADADDGTAAAEPDSADGADEDRKATAENAASADDGEGAIEKEQKAAPQAEPENTEDQSAKEPSEPEAASEDK
jgi:small subunit ribosomal protein S2